MVKKITPTRSITVRFSPEEWEKVRERIIRSTCRTGSEYARKVLMGKPIHLFYRNQSFDAFIDECILLRKEMEAVRQLQPAAGENTGRLLAIHEEIKSLINKLIDQCKPS